MPLATILGVCALLVSAPGSGVVRSAYAVVAQSGQTGQAAPQPDSAQPQAAKPEPKRKSATAPQKAPPGAEAEPAKAAPSRNSQTSPGSAPNSPEGAKGSHSTPAAKNAAKKKKAGKRTPGAPKKTAPSATARKPAHPQTPKAYASDGPAKVVIPNGSTTDPKVQLAPSLSQQQASRQRHRISQLLAACSAELKKLSGRRLNSSQRGVVSQIRMYMEQARAAVAGGDLQRAENLATKANLLAESLVKQ